MSEQNVGYWKRWVEAVECWQHRDLPGPAEEIVHKKTYMLILIVTRFLKSVSTGLCTQKGVTDCVPLSFV